MSYYCVPTELANCGRRRSRVAPLHGRKLVVAVVVSHRYRHSMRAVVPWTAWAPRVLTFPLWLPPNSRCRWRSQVQHEGSFSGPSKRRLMERVRWPRVPNCRCKVGLLPPRLGRHTSWWSGSVPQAHSSKLTCFFCLLVSCLPLLFVRPAFNPTGLERGALSLAPCLFMSIYSHHATGLLRDVL